MSGVPSHRIIFFPGLGADARLLEPQRALHAQIEIPNWISPLPRESLQNYGQRFAQCLDTSTPFFLGGISFGGFLAQEVARHVSAKGLILMASCQSSDNLPLTHRIFCWSAYLTPLFMITAGKLCVAKTRRLFGVVDHVHAKLFNNMLFGADPAFICWCILATLRWRPEHPPSLPALRIHGSNDLIIPAGRTSADHTIDGAAHVVNMAHSKEVNRLIGDWIRQIDESI